MSTFPVETEQDETGEYVPLAADYALAVPTDKRRRLVAGWLYLGIAALLASGLFSVLLVLARTPGIQDHLPWADFFHTAIVVHVDLSVLVWFLSFAGVFWSINSTGRLERLGELALIFAAAGTLVIALSAFVGDGYPLMSNYVPVLQTPVFIAGLLVFGLGVALLVVRSMTAVPAVGPSADGSAVLRFGLNAAAVSTAMALIAFAWSYGAMPPFLEGKPYYELLFWGGGHLLQFTYTLLMLVAWMWLATAAGVHTSVPPRIALLLFALGLVCVFLAPLIYYAYPLTSVEHVKLFTWLMAYGGGLASAPLGLALLVALLGATKAAPAERPFRAALVSSLTLFGVGGIVGFLIEGSNVTIPAHYHGSIVGVTLAFMGLTYYLLPRLGFAEPDRKWATLQPYLYGAGQLLHVLGLVWSGGYGVQRKVAGSAQALDSIERVAGMGLMGLGGLIAIAGGLLFLIVIGRSIMAGRRPAHIPAHI